METISDLTPVRLGHHLVDDVLLMLRDLGALPVGVICASRQINNVWIDATLNIHLFRDIGRKFNLLGQGMSSCQRCQLRVKL